MAIRTDWIQTYTGKQFFFNEPTVEMIDIIDIAHALSNICRFTGHCDWFYSVGDHSRIMSYQFEDKDLALWALLDDASEAYINDLSRPIKDDLGIISNSVLTTSIYFNKYKQIENKIMKCIIEKFNLNPKERPKEIKEMDDRMLITERNQLMKLPPDEWGIDCKSLDVKIYRTIPKSCEAYFLWRFEELTT